MVDGTNIAFIQDYNILIQMLTEISHKVEFSRWLPDGNIRYIIGSKFSAEVEGILIYNHVRLGQSSPNIHSE